MKTRGFTLIELLIVISIIGLLSSIILANLATARSKASDASIESTLRNAASQAALYSISHPTNAALCSDASGFGTFKVELENLGSTVHCLPSINDNLDWAIEATLVSNPNKYFCLDSKGHALYRNQVLFVPDCTVAVP